MKQVYIAEKMIQFDCPKMVNGKKVPILNEYGAPKKGEFEELKGQFAPFEIKKNSLGEQVRTYVFIVDENTPEEIAEWVEKKLVGGGLCEKQEDYIKRTNAEQYHALSELKKAKADNERLAKENESNAEYTKRLEAQIEELKKKRKKE
jgi:hypothetical protein